MAKKAQKRPGRQEREQYGCMWGLISIFDFRHGRTSQKLISDKRRSTKQDVASGKALKKPDLLTNLDENRRVPAVSVKNNVQVRTNRNHPKSGEIHIDDEKPSTSDVNMDVLMEEFFRQIHHISTEHDLPEETYDDPNEKDSEFEEKLSEAIKVFINQRLINGEDEIHPSKELKDALKILSLDEELSLKLLQGPKSATVQYFEDLWNSQAEKKGPDLSKHEIGEPEKVTHSKDRKFFRSKSKKDPVSQSSNTIVILKPSAQAPEKLDDKGSHERAGSHFFLTEVRRRLKQAMGKEQQEMPFHGVSKRFFKAKGDDEKRCKENAGMKSPSKDHFFIEKMARPPVEKPERRQIGKDHGSGMYPRQKMSKMYMEAKKHISEMFTSRDLEVSNTQVPKSLGRILSLPEYNYSPVGTPGRDWGQSFVTAQTRFSSADKFQKQEYKTPGLDSELCPSDVSTPKKAEALSNPSARASCELEIDSRAIVDRTSFRGDVDVAETTEILVQGDNKINDALSEPNSSVIARHNRNADNFNDLDEEHQPPPKKDSHIDYALEVARIRSHPADLPIQPLRIKFEELVLSAADPGSHLKARILFEDSIYEYVKAVLQASELNWDEFYTMSGSSDPLLDLSIFDEVGYLPSELCNDKKLLFDCTNEGLMEVYWRYFGFPLGLSFSKPTTRVSPDLNSAIYEVWKGVCWHFLRLPLTCTLEQIVKKDMAKTGTWMDMQCHCEEMIVEIGEFVFSDLLEETVLSCVN